MNIFTNVVVSYAEISTQSHPDPLSSHPTMYGLWGTSDDDNLTVCFYLCLSVLSIMVLAKPLDFMFL